MNKLGLVVLTLSAVGCGTYGNYLLKQWAEGEGLKHFILGQAVFAVGSILFSFTLKMDQLITVVCFGLGVQLVMNYIVGVTYFHEEFTRIQTAGAGLLVLGACLLLAGGK